MKNSYTRSGKTLRPPFTTLHYTMRLSLQVYTGLRHEPKKGPVAAEADCMRASQESAMWSMQKCKVGCQAAVYSTCHVQPCLHRFAAVVVATGARLYTASICISSSQVLVCL